MKHNTARKPSRYCHYSFPYRHKYHIAADALDLLPLYAVKLHLLEKAVWLGDEDADHLTAVNVDLRVAHVPQPTAVACIYDLFLYEIAVFDSGKRTFYHRSMQIRPPVPSLTILSRVSPSFLRAS